MRDKITMSKQSVEALIAFLHAFITHSDQHGVAAGQAAKAIEALELDIYGPRVLRNRHD